MMEDDDNKQKYKIKGYVSRVVIKYSDNDFQSHFRLNRSSVKILIEKLGNEWISIRRPKVDIQLAVLLFLWTLANQESFRGIGDRFGVDRGFAARIFKHFCSSLYQFRSEFIKWPATCDIPKIANGFEK